MKLIDEATLFNATDEEVWHAIDDEHIERSSWRIGDMVHLLTEVKAPQAIADRIFAELDRESAIMKRLLVRIQTFNEAAKAKLPKSSTESNGLVPPDFFKQDDSVKDMLDAAQHSLWPLSTNAAKHALEMIEIDRKKCAERLAARLADAQIAPQMKSRTPDPKEEPDPLLRIYGSRKQEQLDAAAFAAEVQKMKEQAQRELLISRNAFHQQLRDKYRS